MFFADLLNPFHKDIYWYNLVSWQPYNSVVRCDWFTIYTLRGVIAVRIEVSDVKVLFQWLCTFPPCVLISNLRYVSSVDWGVTT